MLALLAHPARQHERMAEDALQFGFAPDLAGDVANDPAEIGAQRLQRPVGALELFGVGIALMGDERPLAHPLVRLAQLDAGRLRQPCQSLASPMHQFCVGRERHSLRPAAPINLPEINPANGAFLQLQRLAEAHYPTENQASPDSSQTTNLKAPTATPSRRTPIDGDRYTIAFRHYQQRRNGKFWRAHEDNSYSSSTTSHVSLSEPRHHAETLLLRENFNFCLGPCLKSSRVNVFRS